MKQLKLLFSAAALLVLCFLACQKDSKIVITPEPPEDTPVVIKPVVDKAVNADITGKITDETGAAVNGAQVHCGAITATTDVYGIFRFKNVQTFKKYGFVTVEKSGYFKGSRTFVTHEGSSNYVEIQLIPKKLAGTFTASSGGDVTVSTSKVSFTQNTIITAASGAAYTGLVNVYAAYLNPTDENLFALMPGDLRGVDTVGNEVSLKSFGMMNVELEGAGGEKLQVASGKTATLSMDIPSSLSATAPAAIPLWYFNDTTGRWMEQGRATKQGNAYVGTVKHFSFWNCDLPQYSIHFEARLLMKDSSRPLAYALVTISNASMTTFGRTDSLGFVEGMVPEAATLELNVYNRCDQVIYTQDIGPYTGDVNLGYVELTQYPPSALVISGLVKDCSDQPVSSGYVNISLDGLTYGSNIINGQYSIYINRCGAVPTNAYVTVLDANFNLLSEIQQTFVSGSDVNLPLQACGVTAMQFISYNFGRGNISISEPDDSLFSFKPAVYLLAIQGSSKINYNEKAVDLTISSSSETPGLRAISDLKLYDHDTLYLPNDTMRCNITKYGMVNDFIEGNFNGTIKNQTSGRTNEITGNFKVRRTN